MLFPIFSGKKPAVSQFSPLKINLLVQICYRWPFSENSVYHLERTHSVIQKHVFCPKHMEGSGDTDLAKMICAVEEITETFIHQFNKCLLNDGQLQECGGESVLGSLVTVKSRPEKEGREGVRCRWRLTHVHGKWKLTRWRGETEILASRNKRKKLRNS